MRSILSYLWISSFLEKKIDLYDGVERDLVQVLHLGHLGSEIIDCLASSRQCADYSYSVYSISRWALEYEYSGTSKWRASCLNLDIHQAEIVSLCEFPGKEYLSLHQQFRNVAGDFPAYRYKPPPKGADPATDPDFQEV